MRIKFDNVAIWLNNDIKRVIEWFKKAHKIWLRGIIDNYSINISELLELNGGTSIHTKHLPTNVDARGL